MQGLLKHCTFEPVNVEKGLFEMRRAIQQQICSTQKVTVNDVVADYMKVCIIYS